MSYVRAYYHVVINTYNRSCNLQLAYIEHLYGYMGGIIKNSHSSLLAINGTTNHIHLLIDLHPTQNLSTLIQNIKQSSSLWLKSDGRFPKFAGWGREYFACTCAPKDLPAIKQYIDNQREHHGCISFEEELKKIVINSGGEWNDYMLA